ncbi:prolyl oligopeptidase [Friedmanniella endophytica]|uniref:prolyl oligopeptidase n=1 Tax=Microlunatus kandeliicorticis TaxID=1759536 RepID=A0A7W3IQ22_9ACTN|nr:prolyl oligopeptidase family serine peptidase [Microlunatus kandeliicorticis]MBA8793120.1 prolyl oligopeptidase [Microlunatus kandeliicorticis]
MPLDYPETRRDDLVETLHGREIADPYRWLEDPDSAETGDWVSRQNAFSRARLDRLPARDWFLDTMAAVMRRPRAGVPSRHCGRYLVSRNDGRQNQNVVYAADSLEELLAGGRVVVDPNTLSADGTTSVLDWSVSGDGRLLAYAVSEGGSDWLDFRLLDLGTGEPVEDAPIQTKFSVPEWLPDHASYLYCDFQHEGRAAGTQTDALGGARLRLHRVGTPQSDDPVIMEFPDDERLMFWPIVSHDDRWVVVPIVRGTENVNRVRVFPITGDDAGSTLGEALDIVPEAVAEFGFVRSAGSTLIFSTDLDAERGRVVRCDLDALDGGRAVWTELVGQTELTVSSVLAAGDELIVAGLDDARPVLRRYGLDGADHGRVEVPGGALVGLTGEPGDPEFFVGMSDVTAPTTAYRCDAATGEVRALPELVQGGTDDAPAFVPPQVRQVRRRARSTDGTEVPYFVITRADLDLDQPRPTLLYGYGGFKIPVLADYRAAWPAWLAAGGVLVIANLRGGGEFGTPWYDAGRLQHKQNVFDDFAAVARDLAASRITSRDQLAVYGGSNGGLLVGATLTQHPELMAAAIPAVGVLDLLRFHRFTIGSAWVSDYGDPDDPDDFAVALAYSPLHNVRDGEHYPATLVLTGDHDDRVVPLHSHKFTATLQRAQAGEEPILTRIETSVGHGAGKPTDKAVAETADMLAFAAAHTGLTPPA